MDNAHNFFSELVQGLERTVKPTVSRLKEFFGSRTGKAVTGVASSAATITSGGLTASLPNEVGDPNLIGDPNIRAPGLLKQGEEFPGPG